MNTCNTVYIPHPPEMYIAPILYGLRQTANKCMRGHTQTHRPEGVYMLHSLAWEGYIVLWFL